MISMCLLSLLIALLWVLSVTIFGHLDYCRFFECAIPHTPELPDLPPIDPSLYQHCDIANLDSSAGFYLAYSFMEQDEDKNGVITGMDMKIWYSMNNLKWDEKKWLETLRACDSDKDGIVELGEYVICNVCPVCAGKCENKRCMLHGLYRYSCEGKNEETKYDEGYEEERPDEKKEPMGIHMLSVPNHLRPSTEQTITAAVRRFF